MNFVKKRAAQISIEYVAGFLFFVSAVLFVVFSVIDTLPPYFEESENAVEHEVAWLASERAMAYAFPGGLASAPAIANMSRCTQYGALQVSSPAYNNSRGNYTYLRSVLGIDADMDYVMIITKFGVFLPSGRSGSNNTGVAGIDGAYETFEIFNYTTSRYDGVHIGSNYAHEKETVTISSISYLVEKIDAEGKFFIISKNLVDCGRPPGKQKTAAQVKRFSIYNGTLAEMRLVVWH